MTLAACLVLRGGWPQKYSSTERSCRSSADLGPRHFTASSNRAGEPGRSSGPSPGGSTVRAGGKWLLGGLRPGIVNVGVQAAVPAGLRRVRPDEVGKFGVMNGSTRLSGALILAAGVFAGLGPAGCAGKRGPEENQAAAHLRKIALAYDEVIYRKRRPP